MPSSTALKSILVGTPVTVRVSLRNLDDVLTNPVTLTYIVRDPSGAETTYTMSHMEHVSQGVWQLKFETTSAGQWIVNSLATGNGVDVDDEVTFYVRATRV